MEPPSIELLNFIQPGGLQGEEKRNRSGFTWRAWRRMGRMYSRSWSIENRVSWGSASPSSKL